MNKIEYRNLRRPVQQLNDRYKKELTARTIELKEEALLGDIVGAVNWIIDNPPAPTPPIEGTNYVFVYGHGTPTENAIELSAAYDKADTMSPSAFNRVTVVVAPGKYDFGDDNCLLVNRNYIDIVSLTGEADVLLISNNNLGANAINAPIIVLNINGIKIKGIDCGNAMFGLVGAGPDNTYINCTGGEASFGGYRTASGVFINCRGGHSSFGGSDGIASGTFIDCTSGNSSFGGSNGTASGVFTNCTAGVASFGGYDGTASGVFINCTGGEASFGGSNGTASGVFTNCVGGDYSFGGYGTASGVFTNCTAGIASFGGTIGTASGSFIDCIGGEDSFGGEGTTSGTFTNCIGGYYSFNAITETSRLYYCRLTSGDFGTPAVGSRLILCIDGNNNIVTV